MQGTPQIALLLPLSSAFAPGREERLNQYEKSYRAGVTPTDSGERGDPGMLRRLRQSSLLS